MGVLRQIGRDHMYEGNSYRVCRQISSVDQIRRAFDDNFWSADLVLVSQEEVSNKRTSLCINQSQENVMKYTRRNVLGPVHQEEIPIKYARRLVGLEEIPVRYTR